MNSDDLGDESDASDVAGLGQTVLRQDLPRYGQATFLTWSTLKFRKDHNLCHNEHRRVHARKDSVECLLRPAMLAHPIKKQRLVSKARAWYARPAMLASLSPEFGCMVLRMQLSIANVSGTFSNFRLWRARPCACPWCV